MCLRKDVGIFGSWRTKKGKQNNRDVRGSVSVCRSHRSDMKKYTSAPSRERVGRPGPPHHPNPNSHD